MTNREMATEVRHRVDALRRKRKQTLRTGALLLLCLVPVVAGAAWVGAVWDGVAVDGAPAQSASIFTGLGTTGICILCAGLGFVLGGVAVIVGLRARK